MSSATCSKPRCVGAQPRNLVLQLRSRSRSSDGAAQRRAGTSPPLTTRGCAACPSLRQLVAAVEFGKPIVVHVRKAERDALAIMRDLVPPEYKIHLHCYTGDAEHGALLSTHARMLAPPPGAQWRRAAACFIAVRDVTPYMSPVATLLSRAACSARLPRRLPQPVLRSHRLHHILWSCRDSRRAVVWSYPAVPPRAGD